MPEGVLERSVMLRQPVVDRLTLRLLNLGQVKPEDFEGGLQGLRLRPEALRRYFELYEERLRAPSEGAESPSWRERMRHQVEAVREMVMGGAAAPCYQWPG